MENKPKSPIIRFAWWLTKTVVGTVISIVIAGGIWWYFQNKAQTNTTTTLEIASGSVTRNGTIAKDGEVLATGDKLKTTANTDATVTFTNGSQLRLDDNTEITIKDLDNISIYQTLGKTWSRVVKLTGTQTYDVETPTAVATVRGTAFSTTVDSDTGIDTDEGAVDVLQKASKKKLLVEAGFGTRVSKLQKEAIRDEIKNSPWFKRNRERDQKRRGLQPKQILNLVRSVSPGDLIKIKNLVERVRGGQLNLTEAQKIQLEPIARKLQQTNGKIDATVAPDVAAALAIIDPENFGDVAHWTLVLQNAGPLLEKFQLFKVKSE